MTPSLRKIVDTFVKQIDTPGYARLVDFEEIKKHEFNLNLPRYIDGTEAEDIQDIGERCIGGVLTPGGVGFASSPPGCRKYGRTQYQPFREPSPDSST